MLNRKTATFTSYCLCPPQIAEHVDSTDGFLSKLSLYKALALIALAQQGKQPSPNLLENCIQGKCWSDSRAVKLLLNEYLEDSSVCLRTTVIPQLLHFISTGQMSLIYWLTKAQGFSPYRNSLWQFTTGIHPPVLLIICIMSQQTDVWEDLYITYSREFEQNHILRGFNFYSSTMLEKYILKRSKIKFLKIAFF